jgi:polyhydroxyalkanoate synthesis regulator phasin
MDNFLTLYPGLIKYIPNWMEKFYPRMARFAKGDGYPCGNKGVFIPSNKKCWTHPKTGQRLKTPLTYQKYQEAKLKSQMSTTKRGQRFLDERESELRKISGDKLRKNAKPSIKKEIKVLGLIGDGTQGSVPRTHQEYYDAMVKKGSNTTLEDAKRVFESIKGWTRGDHEQIRPDQQKGWGNQAADDIDDFIKNSTPYNGKISRGLAFESTEKAMQWLNETPGVLKQNAHASWTSDYNEAFGYSQAQYELNPKWSKKYSTGTQPVIITVAKNKTGAPIQNISVHFDEAEVIVAKGVQHKITKVANVKGVILIDAIEVLAKVKK